MVKRVGGFMTGPMTKGHHPECSCAKCRRRREDEREARVSLVLLEWDKQRWCMTGGDGGPVLNTQNPLAVALESLRGHYHEA